MDLPPRIGGFLRILTINCGSSSLKAGVFGGVSPLELSQEAGITVEAIGSTPTGTLTRSAGTSAPFAVRRKGYDGALADAVVCLRREGMLEGLSGVGHRVVHGGPWHGAPALLDAATVASIEEATDLAPLHNRPALEAVRAAQTAFPTTPQVAVFDTGFFQDLPAVARTYALPSAVSEKLGIRRYGFHGLAHESMARRYRELTGSASGRVVTLQLGSGCSAAAILDGRPIDTSMGFTPLEGLVMRTRSGDLDPAVPGYVAEHLGWSAAKVERMLNEESGLAGMSGTDGDVRSILKLEEAGDERAKLALDLFCYRACKYVGAYAAALGGLDAIVFGGGIGEHSPEMRRRIARSLGWLGLDFDDGRNENPSAFGGLISADGSRVRCFVVEVDEAGILAEETARCLTLSTGAST
jgi:acetate kinase